MNDLEAQERAEELELAHLHRVLDAWADDPTLLFSWAEPKDNLPRPKLFFMGQWR